MESVSPSDLGNQVALPLVQMGCEIVPESCSELVLLRKEDLALRSYWGIRNAFPSIHSLAGTQD